MAKNIRINNKDVIDKFKKGKIGIFPTDTAFGIGCRMDNEESVEKVFQIRNRPKEKAVLVLVSSIEMVKKYLDEIPQEVLDNILNKYWPGGVTVILKCKKEKVPSIVRSGGDTLAIRLPLHKEIVSIIEGVGVPIVAPSANISGVDTPYELKDVKENLKNKVDFVLSGVCTMKGVSTIIDCTNKEWKIIRQGVVKVDL